MTETIADQNYFLDADGNVTTDSTKAESWLAAKGSVISKQTQERYGIPFSGNRAKSETKVADEAGEKASGPKSNKSEQPKSNKGAKKNGK